MTNNSKHTNVTLSYYNDNVAEFTRDTQTVEFSEFQQSFLSRVHHEGRVLDLGCGAGRDSKAFKVAGYRVEAVDGSVELCKVATEFIGEPVKCIKFQDFVPTGVYDGIWACASLLHLTMNEIQTLLNRLVPHLSPSGCMYVSFKYGSFSGYKNGRFFQYMTEDSLIELLKNIPQLDIAEIKITSDVRLGRSHEKWLNAILQIRSHCPISTRPVNISANLSVKSR